MQQATAEQDVLRRSLYEHWNGIAEREVQWYLQCRPRQRRDWDDYLQQAHLSLWEAIRGIPEQSLDDSELEARLTEAVREGLQQLGQSDTRHQRFLPLDESLAPRPSAADEAEQRETIRLLTEALDELRQEMPQAYLLLRDVYFKGQTQAETATSHGLSLFATRECLRQALASLRAKLQSFGVENCISQQAHPAA
jgi:DNA-directed RNA polymerase specialized sigma24 family protein